MADDAEKSKQLVLDSRRCLAAFQCYHFAIHTKDRKLTAKLLLVGYESGRRFLDGAQKGKLLPDDCKEIAIIFGLVREGPSHDFILGRILEEMEYEQDTAFKEVPTDVWGSLAERELQKRNADLIVDSFKPDLSEGEGKDEAWNRFVKHLQELKTEIDKDNEKKTPQK
jgi:hypothetical protein